jgi:hypothetical protein
LVVGATGTGLTYQWYRGSTALSDGGNIAGASTSALSISPTTWNDAADYNVVVMHSSGNLTTAPVHLTIVSTLTDVTQPGDPISAFGDASAGFWGGNANPALAINEIFDNYQNGGHGFSAAAGFPPFLGPVGVIVTQSVAQLVVGIRIYTSNGDPERDPADVELFGSNDGITWTPMLSSALNLPLARTSAANAVEPIHNPMQEILFDNQISYTNFMVQFTHTKNDNAANSLQIGELELLGGTALTAHHNPDGTLTLTWPTGTLLEATSLSGPWQTNTGSSPLIVTPTGPQKFYKIIVQ